MEHGGAASLQRHRSRMMGTTIVGLRWLLVGMVLGISIGQLSPTLNIPVGDGSSSPINTNAYVTQRISRSSPLASAIESTSSMNHPSPSNSVLPKRIISVFGTESSGSTFLATTLGVASGAFPVNGTYVTVPSDQYNNPGRTIVEHVVAKRATSSNGEIEVQHLSLPWGMWFNVESNCLLQYAKNTAIVDALVPEPCFRFDYESSWPHRMEVPAPLGCRDEAHISETNVDAVNTWTCGAQCGTYENDGYALYPRRFFVNISSHIEWYTARGVDITAVLISRDRSISHSGKMKLHCKDERIAQGEEARGIVLMVEALTKYGTSGTLRNELGRVVSVSYETLMALQSAYLYEIYEMLGINSTYTPRFKDGNEKYIKVERSN
mmetsp:Transcript_4423/g.9893  ORF Transcript_4423/g.9893 Transcript_4423/m.9893 type:complete len:379 (-) Transcript_4423:22-1158(-)